MIKTVKDITHLKYLAKFNSARVKLTLFTRKVSDLVKKFGKPVLEPGSKYFLIFFILNL